MKEPDGFKQLVTNYAAVTMKKDKDLGAQIREQSAQVFAQMLKDTHGEDIPRINQRLNPLDSRPAALKRHGLYNQKAPGAQVDKEFANSAEFFQAIWHRSGALPNAVDLAAKATATRKIQNSFGSTVPADGGFLIPETMRSEILKVSLETSVIRSRARIIPMETLRVPIPAVDSTSNVSSIFGGIVCYWTEEGAQLVESQAEFQRIVLEAKKLTGYAEIPNELMADASAFGAFFDQIFPLAIAWYEDVAFMSGSGVGEPEGFMNAPAVIQVAAEAGQPTGTIVWQNIVKMYARMLPSSLGTAVWLVSPDTFPELATMALSVGTGGSAIWLNNGTEGPPMTILGRPVIVTEKVNSLGNAGDVNFVDLGYYLIGDRQVMQADSSPHYKFANDKTAFRIIERLDGRPWLRSAITPHNGGATMSPFIQIASR
jgi:HK97 family phage major capsid protein